MPLSINARYDTLSHICAGHSRPAPPPPSLRLCYPSQCAAIDSPPCSLHLPFRGNPVSDGVRVVQGTARPHFIPPLKHPRVLYILLEVWAVFRVSDVRTGDLSGCGVGKRAALMAPVPAKRHVDAEIQFTKIGHISTDWRSLPPHLCRNNLLS